MNKPACGKISRLIKNIYMIILFVLLINNYALAASPNSPGASRIASAYQGTLAGDWSGEVMGNAINGTFTIKIAADGTVLGTFSGITSGTISGNINASGEINAKGSAGFSEWSGQVKSTDGHLSGSGTWTGYGGSGSWAGGQ